MSRDTVTIKIWEGSPIIGKTIEEIRTNFNIDIKKVTRGELARNPPGSVVIKSNDYISFEENSDNIKKFIEIVNSK